MGFLGSLFGGGGSSSSSSATTTTNNTDNSQHVDSGILANSGGTVTINQIDAGAVSGGLDVAQRAVDQMAAAAAAAASAAAAAGASAAGVAASAVQASTVNTQKAFAAVDSAVANLAGSFSEAVKGVQATQGQAQDQEKRATGLMVLAVIGTMVVAVMAIREH